MFFCRQYEENDYFGVSGRAGGRPAGAFRGGFLGTRKCSGSSCTIQCTQFFSDNTCKGTGSDAVFKKCEVYVAAVKNQLNAFWNNNVLNIAKTWKKYSDDAKARLKNVKC